MELPRARTLRRDAFRRKNEARRLFNHHPMTPTEHRARALRRALRGCFGDHQVRDGAMADPRATRYVDDNIKERCRLGTSHGPLPQGVAK